MDLRLIEIPLSKLAPAPLNVRRTGKTNGLDELAASIEAHGLLQNLSVRPALDADGVPTGKYLVLGGGRRLAALKMLAKRKALPKAYAVPCIVHGGNEEEISLAENVVRADLHPADQFEAFRRLADDYGFGAEEIAARFGVTATVVKQRMRLGAVSPKLLAIYRENGLTLDQLMAFAITADHRRQEEVYGQLSWSKDPATIRRLLTEGHVSMRDRRAVFVGVEAYEAAGGVIVRDLFSDDGGGSFEDAALLNQLAFEKLERTAVTVREEGWRWVETAIDFPHAHGLRRVYPDVVALSDKDQEELTSLHAQRDELSERYETLDELPVEIAETFDTLDKKIEALVLKRYVFEAEDIACAGAFVVISFDGKIRIERGFIRPEDEPPSPEVPPVSVEAGQLCDEPAGDEDNAGVYAGQDDATVKPLAESLVRDLSAYRTLGLRLELSANPGIAVLAITHGLASQIFYGSYDSGSCLSIDAMSHGLDAHATGIEDSEAAATLSARHQDFKATLPKDKSDLWEAVTNLDVETRLALLAHCIGMTVFAVELPWDRKPLAQGTADRLATALDLDMTKVWRATEASYFSRVTKAQIIDAVAEGVSETAAAQLDSAKKQEMAAVAEELLTGTGWLPHVLRTKPKAPAIADEALLAA